MAKAMFLSEIEGMEVLSTNLTSISDGEKHIRDAVDALFARIEAILRDHGISFKNLDVEEEDFKLADMESLPESCMIALYENLIAVTDGMDAMLSSVETTSSSTNALLVDVGMVSVSVDSAHKDIEAILQHLEAESKELLELHVLVESMSADEIAMFLSKQGISPDSFFELYRKIIGLTSNLEKVPLYLRSLLLGYEAICKSTHYMRTSNEKLCKHTNELLKSMEALSKNLKDISAAEKPADHDGKIFRQELHILLFTMQVLYKVLDNVTLDIRVMHLCIEMMHQGMSVISQDFPEALGELNAAFESLNFLLLRPIAMQIHN